MKDYVACVCVCVCMHVCTYVKKLYIFKRVQKVSFCTFYLKERCGVRSRDIHE
jgi:hypothetical protein